MEVSIIIVNYNTRDLTCQCIDSVLEKTQGLDYEIILVDNASSDESVGFISKKYPQVVLLAQKENLGFGRANNAGVEVARGKYLFLLNSDTILTENVIKTFFDFMEDNLDYTACGCRLVNKENQDVATHGKYPSLMYELTNNPFNKLFYTYFRNKITISQTADEGDTKDTDYISGADVFIRTNAFRLAGGFDSNIFMYYEETDLFARLKASGGKFCVLPNHKIVHLVGGTKTPSLQRSSMYEKGKMYFYRKHHSRIYVIAVKTARLLSVWFSRNAQKKEMTKIIIEA